MGNRIQLHAAKAHELSAHQFVTKSQYKIIRFIIIIIKKLQREYGFAKLDEVLNELDKAGINEKRAKAAIEQLRTQGDIFEPEEKMYKTT